MTWFKFASSAEVETSNGTQHNNAQSTTVTVLEKGKAPTLPGQSPAVATLGDQTKAAISTTQQTVVSLAESQSGKDGRRFSLRSFSFVRKQSIMKAVPSPIEEGKERDKKVIETTQKQAQPKASKSDKLAKQSALAVRSIIVGSTSEGSKVAVAVKPELKKIKSQLLEPETANKLITQLRQLPAQDEHHSNGPIHAVCLGHSDAEEYSQHFSKLVPDTSQSSTGDVSSFIAFPDISDSFDKLAQLYKDMHIIDLIKVSDFGLGQPGDGEGLLAGALPTAETVIEGVKQITPELMALGFATGKAIVPDHTGMLI